MKLVGIAEEQSQNRVPLVFPVISGQYVEIGDSMKMMYDMYDMYDMICNGRWLNEIAEWANMSYIFAKHVMGYSIWINIELTWANMS